MGLFLLVAAATALVGPANIRLGIGARRIRGVSMADELSEIEQLKAQIQALRELKQKSAVPAPVAQIPEPSTAAPTLEMPSSPSFEMPSMPSFEMPSMPSLKSFEMPSFEAPAAEIGAPAAAAAEVMRAAASGSNDAVAVAIAVGWLPVAALGVNLFVTALGSGKDKAAAASVSPAPSMSKGPMGRFASPAEKRDASTIFF